MKIGDPVWLVHEVASGKSMFRGWICAITEKTLRIRREAQGLRIRREAQGLSSIIFSRNENDQFPFYERVPKKRNAKPQYRLELRQ